MKNIKLYLSIICVLLVCGSVLHAQTDVELMPTKSIELKHQQPIKIPKLYAVFCPDCFLYIEGTDNPDIIEYSLEGFPRDDLKILLSGCRDCHDIYVVYGIPIKGDETYIPDETVFSTIEDRISYNLEVPANCRMLDRSYFASIGRPVFLNPILN